MRTPLAISLAALVLVLGACGGDDDDDVAAEGDSTTTVAETDDTGATTGDTTDQSGSAAGAPCVAAQQIPEGAPDVPVKEGAPPTELLVEDLTAGDGAEVAEGSTVTVNYIGVSCSTGAVFDESYTGGQPITFGLDQVIPGWSQGLVGMKVGGTRLLGIPPDLAYGDTGAGGAIGPGETLWFVVELEEVS
jgi:peptidylprolyl isomerase